MYPRAMSADSRYSDHMETLIALTTYLALTPSKSRTAKNVAMDLSLPEDEVRATLDGFPGTFRRSVNRSDAGEHFYTLHARYAMRAHDDAQDASAQAELRGEMLTTLLQFISHRAAQEGSMYQFTRQSAQARVGMWIAASAAMIAAVTSVIAAMVSR